VNGGRSIYPLEAAEDMAANVKTGDELEINLAELVVKDISQNSSYKIKDFGPIKDIIEAGGLTSFNKKQLK